VQESIDLIKIKIAKTSSYEERHGQYIIDELKKRMGVDIYYKIKDFYTWRYT
jgi:hypothetical protein